MYINDVMVISKYQNKKIGTSIMNKLLEKIKEKKGIRVYLGALKGKKGFYKKF